MKMKTAPASGTVGKCGNNRARLNFRNISMNILNLDFKVNVVGDEKRPVVALCLGNLQIIKDMHFWGFHRGAVKMEASSGCQHCPSSGVDQAGKLSFTWKTEFSLTVWMETDYQFTLHERKKDQSRKSKELDNKNHWNLSCGLLCKC